EYAKSLGVSGVYGAYPLIADFVNEMLSQMTARNIALPLSVIIGSEFFVNHGQQMTSTVGMGENGTLFLNSAADFWKDPIAFTRAAFEAKIWSTPHPLHPLYHEVGHLLQAERNTRGKPLKAKEQTEAQAISYRATVGIDEFVAEVF